LSELETYGLDDAVFGVVSALICSIFVASKRLPIVFAAKS